MLNLVLTTDKLQLVTDAAVTVDVHASFADLNGTTVTPGKQNTAITTATTTDIVASPASSTVRNVKTLHVRNKHATDSVGVTVVYDANATDYEIHKVTLLAGELLEYVEGIGFFVVASTPKASFNRRVSGSDVALTNVTPTFADITGLTCPVQSGKHYNFLAQLFHFSSGTTIGARLGINGPTMTALRVNGLDVVTGSVTAAAMAAAVSDVTALDTAIIAQTTGAATTPVLAIVSGWINPSADGTFAMRGAVEATGTLTIKVGSWLQLWEADN